MNTFKSNFKKFPEFMMQISQQKYDYYVPVAKKGCKLIKASKQFKDIDYTKLRYKTFFDLFDINLNGKKIAVIDDATQYTATLLEYREYFEKRGAIVDTYSFVGHGSIYTGDRWKYDEKAIIKVFLEEPVYQEYILQQSYYLLESGNQFDLDHLIFEITINKNEFNKIIEEFKKLGVLVSLEDYFLKDNTYRFSLTDLNFFDKIPYFKMNNVDEGFIKKIKFVYKPKESKLYFSPLIFPSWNYEKTHIMTEAFSNVPFMLPFISEIFDKKNKNSLLRLFHCIQLIYSVSLIKAFIQNIKGSNYFVEKIILRRDDFDAVYGPEVTEKLISSYKAFLFADSVYEYQQPDTRVKEDLKYYKNYKYKSFGRVIDKLKKDYENLVKKRKTRVGVHSFLSYNELFPKFFDKLTLNECLDYFCDFGVIVPETYFEQGSILRGIRSGEPFPDTSWVRTQVLIPTFIDYIQTLTKDDNSPLVNEENNDIGVQPMLLNKILANFSYDYPCQDYNELHCLVGKPYTFGTLMYVFHKLRAPESFSIYNKRISPYFKYHNKSKRFITINSSEYRQKLRSSFADQQEVPYSEIITYVEFLIDVFKKYKRVDVLNQLSICRDQEYFYSHILYNIRAWISDYGLFIDLKDKEEKIKNLHNSGTNVNSALQKYHLMISTNDFLKDLERHYGNNIKYLKVLDKIKENYNGITDVFKNTLDRVFHILKLQRLLTNISLYHNINSSDYLKVIKESSNEKLCSQENIPIKDILNEKTIYSSSVKQIYGKIINLVNALPEERPMLESRLRKLKEKRARNRVKTFVQNYSLDRITILNIDFTGFRKIPDPKEPTLSQYYDIVSKKAKNRQGNIVYGGASGDDAFSILFYEPINALECCVDIKNEFASDLFLADYDLKFGVSSTLISKENVDNDIINCWGYAKDSCELKSEIFRNRGNLLIRSETFNYIKEFFPSVVKDFDEIKAYESPKDYKYYSYKRIKPLH